MNILVLGGDRRNLELIKLLDKEEINVKAFAIEGEGIEKYLINNLEEAINTADKIILGIPFSKDGETLNAATKISITYLINQIKENQEIYGGVLNEEFLLKAHNRGAKCFDFMKYEEFAILNTIPTVEGAIEIAIKNTEITLHNANILVAGYGRIGKLIAKILKDMGANVTVSARKNEDFAWINTYGYNKLEYKDLVENVEKYDIIFNTVPYMLFDEEVLKRINKECLIIDLASKPGGIDFSYANRLGVNCIWALGLPGKVACKSAAKYMLEVIFK